MTAPKSSGKVPRPKYRNDAEILAEYYRSLAPVDPVADAITDDELLALMAEED